MVNAKPTAEISPLPAQVALNTVLTLDGSSSFDSEGYITAYVWSNGSVTDTTTVVLNTEGEQCFTLLVTNNSNATDTETACTWVGERPPVSEFDNAYFRGTSNGWQATSMTLIADNTWSVTISFTGAGDSTGAQRFKFDRFGDWAENYGDNGQDGLLDQAGEDILFTGVGTFDVRFNDETMLYSFETSGNQAPVAEITSQKTTVKVGETITLDGTRSSDIDGHVTDYVWSNGSKAATTVFASQIAGDFEISLMVKDDLGKESLTEAVIHITVEKESNGFISQYPSMAARGTFNGWSVSPMFLIADNIWSIEITFTGNASPVRFKFDAYGDWQTNFGDNYADGSLERNGDDILVTTPGTYILELNELDHSYSINKKAQ